MDYSWFNVLVKFIKWRQAKRPFPLRRKTAGHQALHHQPWRKSNQSLTIGWVQIALELTQKIVWKTWHCWKHRRQEKQELWILFRLCWNERPRGRYWVREGVLLELCSYDQSSLNGKQIKVEFQDDSKRRKDSKYSGCDVSKGCYNCGKMGHFARECHSARNNGETSNHLEGGSRGGYHRHSRSRSRSEDSDRHKKTKRRHRSDSSDRGRSRSPKSKKCRRGLN
jgi:hypothetical protein